MNMMTAIREEAAPMKRHDDLSPKQETALLDLLDIHSLYEEMEWITSDYLERACWQSLSAMVDSGLVVTGRYERSKAYRLTETGWRVARGLSRRRRN